MMTAAAIAKGLGLPKFQVNNLYSEIMLERYFDKNPLKKMVASGRDQKKVVEQYFDGVDFEQGTEFKEGFYPETK